MIGREIARRAQKFSLSWEPYVLRPTLWLDSSALSSLAVSSGSVSAWNSKTNGLGFVQGTAGNQPTLSQSSNKENRIVNSRVNTGSGGRYVDRLTATDDTADTADPWGGNSATKCMETTDSGTHYVAFNWNVSAGRTYRLRAYVKDNGRGYVRFMFDANNTNFSNTAWIVVNLTTGAVNATGAGLASYSVADAGNGWWLLKATATAIGSTSPVYLSAFYASKSDNSYSYAGDIAKGFFLDQVTLQDAEADDEDVITTASKIFRGINNLPVVHFDGNDIMTSSIVASTLMSLSIKTVVLVFRPHLINSLQLLFSQSNGQYLSYHIASTKDRAGFANYVTAFNSIYATIAANNVYIAFCEHKAGYLHHDLNGVVSTPVASNDTNRLNGTMVLGSLSGGASYFSGDFCEFITFDRTLSEKEKERLKGYLNEKWRGI